MTTPPIPNWFNSGNDAEFSDPDQCAARATVFERKVKVRNGIEYAAGALMSALIGAAAIGALMHGHILFGLSFALLTLGIVFAVWNLRQRASNLVRHPEEPCLAYLTRQYRHQYEALRSVPMWYIGPFVPGVLLLLATVTAGVAEVAGWTVALQGILQPAAIIFGMFGLVILANLWVARALKKQLDAFEALA